MKVYGYELRRLILNKFFLALLLITACYSFYVMRSDIIMGIASTAPFSAWSYGTFLSLVSPLLLVTLLFFITYLYSGTEKMVRMLTMASSVDPIQYGMVKCFAMATGFLLISGAAICVSFVFYAKIFRFYDFAVFVVPVIMALLPSMLCVMGVGMAAGRIHRVLLYALMLFMLLVGRFSLPYAFDLLGGSFFQNAPMALPIGVSGEPDFMIPIEVVIGKIGFSVLGIILVGVSLLGYKGNRQPV